MKNERRRDEAKNDDGNDDERQTAGSDHRVGANARTGTRTIFLQKFGKRCQSYKNGRKANLTIFFYKKL